MGGRVFGCFGWCVLVGFLCFGVFLAILWMFWVAFGRFVCCFLGVFSRFLMGLWEIVWWILVGCFELVGRFLVHLDPVSNVHWNFCDKAHKYRCCFCCVVLMFWFSRSTAYVTNKHNCLLI